MKTASYKGFQASVEFEDGALFVRVLHVDDLLVAQCDSASQVASVLAGLIDDYLDDCRELGKEPTKPFSGTFNVRIGNDAHRRAAVAAAAAGQNLNSWVSDAITEKLECSNLSSRMASVIANRAVDIELIRFARTANIARHVRVFRRETTTAEVATGTLPKTREAWN